MKRSRCVPRCRRGFGALARAAAATVVTTSVGAGAGAAQQTSRPGPVPCAVPAERIDWDENVIYAGLGAADSGARQTPQMYRLLLLEDIAIRLQRALAPGQPRSAPGVSARIPAADGRYGPRVLISRLRFSIRGDGSVGRIALADTGRASASRWVTHESWPTDTLFVADLRRALTEMSAERALMAPPGVEPTDSADLVLWVWDVPPSEMPVKLDSTQAAWPLFRLTVPRAKPVAPAGGASPRFPTGPRRRGIGATILVEFVVDEYGRGDPTTVQDRRGPGDIPPRYEKDYQEFVKAIRDAIPRMKYIPAEFMGCRVKQLVQQPFKFGYGR